MQRITELLELLQENDRQYDRLKPAYAYDGVSRIIMRELSQEKEELLRELAEENARPRSFREVIARHEHRGQNG